MDGYKEAGKFDEAINRLLKENPITPENAREWYKFARTLNTSANIALETCFGALPGLKKTEEGSKIDTT